MIGSISSIVNHNLPERDDYSSKENYVGRYESLSTLSNATFDGSSSENKAIGSSISSILNVKLDMACVEPLPASRESSDSCPASREGSDPFYRKCSDGWESFRKPINNRRDERDSWGLYPSNREGSDPLAYATYSPEYSDAGTIASDVVSPARSDYTVAVRSPLSIDRRDAPKRTGRLPGFVDCITTRYNGNEYVVVGVQYKSSVKHFVCDCDDLDIIEERNWHVSSGKYIGANRAQADGTIKEVYIHNFIMYSELRYADEGAIVIHKNKNAFDNRRANLKVVSHDDMYKYKGRKKRIINLPEDADITMEDIPKYVSYMKASGGHGDRFTIEIPQLNIFWKSSSSKKNTLKVKLDEAIQMLAKIKAENPGFEADDAEEVARLSKEFDEILKAAGVEEKA